MKPKEILILTRKPEIYSSRRLIEAVARQGLAFRTADPETTEWGDPSVALPRIGTWRFKESIAALLPRESECAFINSPTAYQASRNKWLCLQKLGAANLSTPLTQLVSRDEFNFLRPPYAYVLKEIFSGQGQGTFLIRDNSELQSALSSLPDSDLFLVQEYIAESHGEDLRIFVTRAGDHWTMIRRNSTGDFRSNISCGGLPYRESPVGSELEMAFRALEIFQLDYAGVDILRSKEGPLLIEVNPCPGFEGLESLHGPVVAESIVRLTGFHQSV